MMKKLNGLIKKLNKNKNQYLKYINNKKFILMNKMNIYKSQINK